MSIIINIPVIASVKSSIKQKNELKSKKQFEQELIGEIEIIISRLEEIHETFDMVSENELIDAVIYEEMSLKSHYAYLLRVAKENNVKYVPSKKE